ncbi:MAG: sorbosone dehydrogenase family protein, partial [Balneolaceae bacterium]
MNDYALFVLIFIVSVLPGCSFENSTDVTPENVSVDYLSAPAGFTVELFAENVPNVRAMTYSPGGIIYAGSRGAGNVYAIIDKNNDFRADTLITIAENLS